MFHNSLKLTEATDQHLHNLMFVVSKLLSHNHRQLLHQLQKGATPTPKRLPHILLIMLIKCSCQAFFWCCWYRNWKSMSRRCLLRLLCFLLRVSSLTITWLRWRSVRRIAVKHNRIAVMIMSSCWRRCYLAILSTLLRHSHLPTRVLLPANLVQTQTKTHRLFLGLRL